MLPAVLLFVGSGCATLPKAPGRKPFHAAVMDAALDPQTWIPATAALLIQIDGTDTRISEWGADATPIFGSRHAASRASDNLRLATVGLYVSTLLATPSGTKVDQWLMRKLRVGAVGVGAQILTSGAVGLLKEGTGRTRPDDTDDLSFPSGHAASSSLHATLASRNIESLSLSNRWQAGLQIGCISTAAACGWARVEGRHHYPSDVLTGFALGHFIGVLMTDVLLGFSGMENVNFVATKAKDETSFGINLHF
ncbi:MAG: phosphatase PAP2 family protein [Candidatus Eisenbacteria bacterium]|uniref:Phosphatase PAP2 family protein n=1 Tax=Eiseniibacteriota bacterium TaxID=2212470 RepID=A0A948WES9_UNCEI|nr:phosphatase PAP2 family protein [Candidatus Eisenbacteria bacterium]MBU1949645.1 phosphatase PAP2 family protein [Candidatus Eisenbacteria bacterium]MBU2693038.1 phosphatase PAP2 family protein [Candidatus Eisenbacteria bacterium]